MIVSLKHKFAYMPVVKTGTTSMEKVLREHYDATRSHGPVKRKFWIDKHDVALRQDHADFFVFATVRNPFSHEESKWRYFEKELPFERFIIEKCRYEESFHCKLKQDDYDPPKGWVKFKIHAVVRVEHMADDFHKLPFVEKQVEIPCLRTRKEESLLHWTPNMCDTVRKERRLDFEAFGYSTERNAT